jgi:hypothetical protein
MFLTSKKETNYYSWDDGSKSEQEKENQFACYCILKWGMEWISWWILMPGMEKHDAQLALAQNNNVGGELDY